MSEYRALRASVLRLWLADGATTISDYADLIRFNEAIDQAIAESVEFFDAQLEMARNLLLGMLGHDMRTPLWAIRMTAEFLQKLNAGTEVSEAAAVLIRSGTSMQALLDDLVDFNRTRLGVGVNISPAVVDLSSRFSDELKMLRRAHPGHALELKLVDDTTGYWDGHRLQQLLRNLVVNAIKYGAATSPVRIVLSGDVSELIIEVINAGPVIEQAALDQLFEPLKRGSHHEQSASDGSLGLGLFIAREIALAHGGHIHATSIDEETTFTVRLPRYAVVLICLIQKNRVSHTKPALTLLI
jgi:signal transduction histidine kinase